MASGWKQKALDLGKRGSRSRIRKRRVVRQRLAPRGKLGEIEGVRMIRFPWIPFFFFAGTEGHASCCPTPWSCPEVSCKYRLGGSNSNADPAPTPSFISLVVRITAQCCKHCEKKRSSCRCPSLFFLALRVDQVCQPRLKLEPKSASW